MYSNVFLSKRLRLSLIRAEREDLPDSKKE